MTITITLDTKDFGPTGFEVVLGQDGEVLNVTSAAAQLPELVFRLTYGDRWEDAREHFQRLADNLSYRVEAAAWINDTLPEYKFLRRVFRKASTKTVPPNNTEAPLYARRVAFWLSHPEARPALFLQKKAASGFNIIAGLLKSGKADPQALQPWLFSLINLLQDVEHRHLVYHLIGLLKTPTSAEYLFSELERPGRHPYATGLLGAVQELAIPENTGRILGLHDSLADDIGQVKDYLKVVGRLQGGDVHLVILAILHRHPALAGEVLEALRSSGHPTPGTAIRERFNQEENLFLLDLIAELIDAEPEGIRVSLKDMNVKIDSPVLNTAAPVTWPQMLGPNWTKLVLAVKPNEFFSLISQYLQRKEPWLQRNALLQLNVWVQAQTNMPPIPLTIEKRMRELISSRYEKVYTVALHITEQLFDWLSEPELMVDAVLAHAPTSNYRLMNVAALKKAAQNPVLKERQITSLRSAFRDASSREEIIQLERLIPYLRFLGVREELNSLAKDRLTTF
ncbi:MAG: hypothetical protein ACJATN_001082 [Neolewinella sp.]|jgi:hypothetical protein